jgi:hypothetical protein
MLALSASMITINPNRSGLKRLLILGAAPLCISWVRVLIPIPQHTGAISSQLKKPITRIR